MVQGFGLPQFRWRHGASSLRRRRWTDIGMQAVETGWPALVARDWAVIWGLCLSIFVAVQVILPAIFWPRCVPSSPNRAGLQQTGLIIAATGRDDGG